MLDSFDFEHDGKEFRATIHHDDSMGAPWKEHEGHGPVSDWTTRNKEPGELVLNEDGESNRFYDFAAACKIALRDGWDSKPYNTGQETKRQQAAKAARANFEHLKAWCDDDWCWQGVEVKAKCLCCDEYSGESRSLWGIDGGDEYLQTVAIELAGEFE